MKWIYVLLVLFILGCKPSVTVVSEATPSPTALPLVKVKNGEIKGEVFVVTQGAANVVLGRVAVRAYKRDLLENTIQDRKHTAAKIIEQAGPLLKEMETKLDVLFNSSYKTANYDPSWSIANQKVKAARSILEYFQSGLYYTSNLPEPVDVSMTDSSGRYLLNLQPGDYVIAASASRFVGEETEYYYWLLECQVKEGEVIELTLCNDNTTTSAGLVHTSAVEKEAFQGRRIVEAMKENLMNTFQTPTPSPTPFKKPTPTPQPMSYITVGRITLPDKDGVIGIPEGTVLRFIKRNGKKLRLSNGDVEFEVDESAVKAM